MKLLESLSLSKNLLIVKGRCNEILTHYSDVTQILTRRTLGYRQVYSADLRVYLPIQPLVIIEKRIPEPLRILNFFLHRNSTHYLYTPYLKAENKELIKYIYLNFIIFLKFLLKLLA